MNKYESARNTTWMWIRAQLRRTALEARWRLPIERVGEDDQAYVMRVLPELRDRVEEIRPFPWSGSSGAELEELDRRINTWLPGLHLPLPART